MIYNNWLKAGAADHFIRDIDQENCSLVRRSFNAKCKNDSLCFWT